MPPVYSSMLEKARQSKDGKPAIADPANIAAKAAPADTSETAVSTFAGRTS